VGDAVRLEQFVLLFGDELPQVRPDERLAVVHGGGDEVDKPAAPPPVGRGVVDALHLHVVDYLVPREVAQKDAVAVDDALRSPGRA